ncbi:hypothetical protein COU74_02650 [Candidatus Peregrinibacteria bacterium CG10_big_fil_rev_8_21_14_0_10_36_19]|nr:MAG: hypothetical protein COU74_02650 [Candidatus Peregrinibacteria bacterium CG10_big_fil_rev_8_21_14_0_10_36_19]
MNLADKSVDFWGMAEKIGYKNGEPLESPEKNSINLFSDFEESKRAFEDAIQNSISLQNEEDHVVEFEVDKSSKLKASISTSDNSMIIHFGFSNNIVGSFSIFLESNNIWNMSHRFVTTSLRGKGLAKLALFAMENYLKKITGGNSPIISLDTSQLQVITWLLKEGFTANKNSKTDLDSLLESPEKFFMLHDDHEEEDRDFWIYRKRPPHDFRITMSKEITNAAGAVHDAVEAVILKI